MASFCWTSASRYWHEMTWTKIFGSLLDPSDDDDVLFSNGFSHVFTACDRNNVRGMMHGQSSAMLRLPCSSCYVVQMQQKPRRHCRLCPWCCRISRAIQHKRSTRSGRMAEVLMGYSCAMACTHIMKISHHKLCSRFFMYFHVSIFFPSIL